MKRPIIPALVVIVSLLTCRSHMDRHTDPQRHTSPGPLHGADLSGMAPAADVDLHAVELRRPAPRRCACGHPERPTAPTASAALLQSAPQLQPPPITTDDHTDHLASSTTPTAIGSTRVTRLHRLESAWTVCDSAGTWLRRGYFGFLGITSGTGGGTVAPPTRPRRRRSSSPSGSLIGTTADAGAGPRRLPAGRVVTVTDPTPSPTPLERLPTITYKNQVGRLLGAIPNEDGPGAGWKSTSKDQTKQKDGDRDTMLPRSVDSRLPCAYPVISKWIRNRIAGIDITRFVNGCDLTDDWIFYPHV